MRAWERQPDESARAYEAFAAYRDMGTARSLAKVGQMLGKSRALMERWSSEHDWVDRVAALGARDEMLRREAVEAHVKEKAEDFAEREGALKEQALRIREEAAKQALLMLQWPLTEKRATNFSEETGEPVEMVFLPAGWSKNTVTAFYGMVAGRDPLPEGPQEDEGEEDFSDLSTDELKTLLSLAGKIQPKKPG